MSATIVTIFSKDRELVYCKHEGFLQDLGCIHNTDEWRLWYIDLNLI